MKTFDFSLGAREPATGLDMKVVLIDGRELTQLMIGNNLGVNMKGVYEVMRLGKLVNKSGHWSQGVPPQPPGSSQPFHPV